MKLNKYYSNKYHPGVAFKIKKVISLSPEKFLCRAEVFKVVNNRKISMGIEQEVVFLTKDTEEV